MFVVDAYAPNTDPSVTARRDPRDGLLDYIIDSNFSDAIDALLARRRDSALRERGFAVRTYGAASQPFLNPAWPGDQGPVKDLLSHPGRYEAARVVSTPLVPPGTDWPKNLPIPSCTIWHLDMSSVDVDSAEFVPDSSGKSQRKWKRDDPVVRYRENVRLMTSRTKTDFNLSGPSGCASSVLATALRDSAYILTNEDDVSRNNVCAWFRERGLETSANFPCGKRTAPLRQRDLHVVKAVLDPERPDIVEISCNVQ
jgi:hypothetical protein